MAKDENAAQIAEGDGVEAKMQPVFFEEYGLIDPNEYDFINCDTRVNRNGPYRKVDVVAAIVATGGIYSQMAGLLGRRRSGIKDFVEGNPDIHAVKKDLQETLLDSVEQSQFVQAIRGDGPSGRFLLSTLAKDRGYSTRLESTGLNGAPIDHRISLEFVKPPPNEEP